MSDEQTQETEQQPLTKQERHILKKQQKQEARLQRQSAGKLKTFAGWIIGIAVVFGIIWWAAKSSTTTAPTTNPIEVSESDNIRGSADAPVTIVEFSDFQCPACKTYESSIQKILAENPDTVRLVYRHFPLISIHPNAEEASWASEAAGIQGKFWEMHDMLFERQSDWSNLRNVDDIFATYAQTLELDANQYAQDYASSEVRAKVTAERQAGLLLGVNATPTFYINGKKQSPQGLDEFRALIQQAIAASPAREVPSTTE